MADEFVPTVDHLSTHRPIPTVTLWNTGGRKLICNASDKELWVSRGWSDVEPSEPERYEPTGADDGAQAAGEDNGVSDDIAFVERVYVEGAKDIEKVTKADLERACRLVGAKAYGSKPALFAELAAKLRDA